MESRWVGEIPVGLRRSQGTRDCAGMAGSMTSTMLLSTSGEKVLGTFLEGPSRVGMGLLASHSSKLGKRKQRSLARAGHWSLVIGHEKNTAATRQGWSTRCSVTWPNIGSVTVPIRRKQRNHSKEITAKTSQQRHHREDITGKTSQGVFGSHAGRRSRHHRVSSDLTLGGDRDSEAERRRGKRIGRQASREHTENSPGRTGRDVVGNSVCRPPL